MWWSNPEQLEMYQAQYNLSSKIVERLYKHRWLMTEKSSNSGDGFDEHSQSASQWLRERIGSTH